jgi:chromate transporter
MYKKAPKGLAAYIVMGASFVLTAFLNVNFLFVIVGCAVFGLITSIMASKKEGNK